MNKIIAETLFMNQNKSKNIIECVFVCLNGSTVTDIKAAIM